MKNVFALGWVFAGLLVCSRVTGWAAESEYFRHFQHELAANPSSWELTSPALVNTNNVGFKLTNALTHLEKLKAGGEVAGVKVGMSMDEVVKLWGRPLQLWVKGFPGARFCYKEVNLFFEPAGNRVKTIYTQDLQSLERMMALHPTLEDCVRALGTPAFRDDSEARAQCFLVYHLPEVTLKLGFWKSKLSSLQVERAD